MIQTDVLDDPLWINQKRIGDLLHASLLQRPKYKYDYFHKWDIMVQMHMPRGRGRGMGMGGRGPMMIRSRRRWRHRRGHGHGSAMCRYYNAIKSNPQLLALIQQRPERWARLQRMCAGRPAGGGGIQKAKTQPSQPKTTPKPTTTAPKTESYYSYM